MKTHKTITILNFLTIIILAFCSCGCGKKISDEGKEIVETMVQEADKWERDNIWTMSFVEDEGSIELFYIWYESPVGDFTGSRKYWYSTSSPVRCTYKSDYATASIYGGSFTPCWNTNWGEETKRDKLTELFIKYQYGD